MAAWTPACAEETGLLQNSLPAQVEPAASVPASQCPLTLKPWRAPPPHFVLCLWFCLPLFYLLLFLCCLPPSQHFVKWLLGKYLLSPSFHCLEESRGAEM